MMNSLDLDFCDKQTALKILGKIKTMPCCEGYGCKASATKGYHVLIYCKTEGCQLCRVVFDSPKRFENDLRRPAQFQNVLFDEKKPLTQCMLCNFQPKGSIQCIASPCFAKWRGQLK